MDNNSLDNNQNPQDANLDQQSQNPIKPAEVRLAGDSSEQFGQPAIQPTSPRVAPIAAGLGNPLPPQRQGGRMGLIIGGVVLLVLGICAVIFYFAYWINPNVVFSRFSSNSKKILEEAISNQAKLVGDVKYNLNISSNSQNLKFGVASKGRAKESSSESSSQITYKSSTLGLDVKQPPPTNGQTPIYFKYQNLNKFLNNIVGAAQLKKLGFNQVGMQKYDNKWISLNPATFLGSISNNDAQAGSDTTGNKTTNDNIFEKSDYDALNKAFAPVIATAVSGTNKSKGLFSYKKPKSEKVNNIDTFAYTMEFSQNNYNSLISDLAISVDSTNLSDGKKAIVKDSLEGLKQQGEASKDKNANDTPSQQTDLAQSFSNALSQNKTTTTFTIWLEKNTSAPVQISVVTNVENAGKQVNNTSFIASIKKFTTTSFSGDIILVSEDKQANYKPLNSKIGFVLNPNSNKIDLVGTATYKTSAKSAEAVFNLNLNLEPNTDQNPVQKPAQATNFENVLPQILAIPESADL
jgi:hypothetical protein